MTIILFEARVKERSASLAMAQPAALILPELSRLLPRCEKEGVCI